MGSYVPNTLDERKAMLNEIGYESIDDLFRHIPEQVKIQGGLDIPEGMSEMEVLKKMKEIAKKNKVFPTIFRGAGAYRHYIPAMVNNVISKENLQTAYTPYQAEISQGILQSIFEYQTMMADLTGMDVSNASVYDGATAAAEAVAMCADRKRKKAFVSATVMPSVLEVIKTYCFGNELEIEVIPEKDGVTDIDYLKEHIDKQAACVLIQHPNYYGSLEDAQTIGEVAHEAGAKYVMSVNPISLGALKTGMNILLKKEHVALDRMMGHGGLFKTKGVGQRILAGAIDTPVYVMETAGEGGAWGIALLADYLVKKEENESLTDYLENKVFHDAVGTGMDPVAEDVEGYEKFMETYTKGLAIEKAAVENL